MYQLSSAEEVCNNVSWLALPDCCQSAACNQQQGWAVKDSHGHVNCLQASGLHGFWGDN